MTTGLTLSPSDALDALSAVASISADELQLFRIECEAMNLAALLWSKYGPRTEPFRAAICTCYSLGLSNASITFRLHLRLRHSNPIKQPSFKEILHQVAHVTHELGASNWNDRKDKTGKILTTVTVPQNDVVDKPVIKMRKTNTNEGANVGIPDVICVRDGGGLVNVAASSDELSSEVSTLGDDIVTAGTDHWLWYGPRVEWDAVLVQMDRPGSLFKVVLDLEQG